MHRRTFLAGVAALAAPMTRVNASSNPLPRTLIARSQPMGVIPPDSRVYTVDTTGDHYGSGGTQNATIYRPNVSGARPTVFFIHGGGWVAGGRSAWDVQARDWASHGWVAVNMDYTRAVNLNDGNLQLADVSTVVKKYANMSYVDESKMIIVGDSAGGHMATTMGVKMQGYFKGVIAYSPICSPWNAGVWATDPSATAQQISLGQRANSFYNGISQGLNQTVAPFRYVDAYPGEVPMWIAGSEDEWPTWAVQGGALVTALLAHGDAMCERRLMPGTLHATDIRDAHPSLEADAYYWAETQIA